MEKPENAKPTQVYGIHAVQSLLEHTPTHIHSLLINRERNDQRIQKLLHLAKQQLIKINYVDKVTLDQYAQHHQGVIALCSNKKTNDIDLPTLLTKITAPPLLLILDSVQDPHNLGACLRTANAAGVDAMVVPKDRSASLNATARKVASGAADITPIISVTNLARTLRFLKEQRIWLYGMADAAKSSLYQTTFIYPTAFILGAEGEGLRRLTREHCDEILSIPMAGAVSSLNVSVAAGICLFEAVRQRQFALR